MKQVLNFQILRNEYLESIPEKIGRIKYLWSCVMNSKSIDENVLALHRLIHNLIGSGKIYGLGRVACLCSKIEYELRSAIESNSLDQLNLKKVSRLITTLLYKLEKIRQ